MDTDNILRLSHPANKQIFILYDFCFHREAKPKVQQHHQYNQELPSQQKVAHFTETSASSKIRHSNQPPHLSSPVTQLLPK